MTNKETIDTLMRYKSSWRGFSPKDLPNSVKWEDWNGNYHIAKSVEELANQLKEAPICQTK